MRFRVATLLLTTTVGLAAAASGAESARGPLVFCCTTDNDLYRVLTASGRHIPRVASPAQAVRTAAPGAGVLILAEGYPDNTTLIVPELFQEARKKNLRLYVEYPSTLPGLELESPVNCDGSGRWWHRTPSGPSCPRCES